MGSSPRLALQGAENSQRQLLACVFFLGEFWSTALQSNQLSIGGEGNSPQCRRGGSLCVLTGCSALEWSL